MALVRGGGCACCRKYIKIMEGIRSKIVWAMVDRGGAWSDVIGGFRGDSAAACCCCAFRGG